jgi:hypothetical protein
VAVVLFIVSGPLRRRRVSQGQTGASGSLPAGAARGQLATRPADPISGKAPAKAPAKARKGKDDDDDDLGDVADILRRHGIT